MKLPATLTLKEASAVARALEQEIARTPPGGTLSVDACALLNFDTGAIAVILQGLRAAKVRSVSLTLQRAPEKFSRLAALYGVNELLDPQDPAATGLAGGASTALHPPKHP